MRKILFVDRDGTLIREAPPTYRVDSFSKLEFYPGMLTWMSRIAKELDFDLVMVTNQDGLGTKSFPESSFWPVQHYIMKRMETEGIVFKAVYIDKTFPQDNSPTRKPGIGMLVSYCNNPQYDIPHSFVIGDRITDVQMAKNLSCQAIWLNQGTGLGDEEIKGDVKELQSTIALETTAWKEIYELLKGLRVKN